MRGSRLASRGGAGWDGLFPRLWPRCAHGRAGRPLMQHVWDFPHARYWLAATNQLHDLLKGQARRLSGRRCRSRVQCRWWRGRCDCLGRGGQSGLHRCWPQVVPPTPTPPGRFPDGATVPETRTTVRLASAERELAHARMHPDLAPRRQSPSAAAAAERNAGAFRGRPRC